MANGNPFYIEPAAVTGGLQGLGALAQGYMRRQQQQQAQQAQQKALSDIQSALATDDVSKVQEVMIQYPELASSIESGFQFRSEATKQDQIQRSFAILGGADGRQELGDRAMQLEANGIPADQTRLGMGLSPEQQRQGAMMTIAALGSPEQIKFAQSLLDRPELGEGTANMQDWREYQRLKRTSPEDAKQFGMKVGFVQPDGKELSSHLQKRLSLATDAAIESESVAASMEGLAQEFADANVGGGAAQGKWREAYKDFTGQQDAVTELRKRYNAIRGSQVVKNLPPGAASDTDIQLALSGFPSDNAPGVQIESFLRGVAKLEREKAKFENFKANFISENASERGLLKSWRDQLDEAEAALPEPLPGATPGAGTVATEETEQEPIPAPAGEPTLEELLQQYGGS